MQKKLTAYCDTGTLVPHFRLEFERLQQIQEEQMRLEQERFKQQQRLRLEQIRLEEERKKHEKLQAERNALYNRQRLDMEAQFFSGGEGDRQHRETVQATASTTPEVRQKRRKEKYALSMKILCFTVPVVQKNSHRWRFGATDFSSSTMLRLKRDFYSKWGRTFSPC